MSQMTNHSFERLPVCDPWRMPLTGMSLIEASAGTGKTWTMAALAVRALVAEHIPPAEMALVTFTKAATQELRQRIEARLLEVLDACQQVQHGLPLPDTDGGQDVQQMQTVHELGLDTIKQRSEQALTLFDELRVKTIHGFCLTLLQDHGHLVGLPPIVMDDSTLPHRKRHAITDFWVKANLTASPAVRQLLNESKLDVSQLLRDVNQMGTAPLNAVFPQTTWEAWLDEYPKQTESMNQQALEWHQQGLWQAFFDVLKANQDTLKKTTNPARNLAEIRAYVLTALSEASGAPDALMLDVFGHHFGSLTHAKCHSIVKTSADGSWLDDPKWLPMWSWLDAFKQHQTQSLAAMMAAMRWSMLTLARQVDDDMLHAWGKLDNDSLIRTTHAAMNAHPTMVDAVRASMKLLFVDEFQDTDLNQFEIFASILGEPDTTERGLLVVGDPKQAIYGFRGGDVFAYQLAKQKAQHCYGLHTTRRSHQALCASINALFTIHDDVFVERFIDYPHIDAHHHIKPSAPWQDHACHIQWLHPDTDMVENKGDAEKMAVQACVARVCWMQENDWLAPEHAIDPSATSIGILVASNSQVASCKEAFNAAGIPVLAHGTESVFAAPVATSMLHLLEAVLRPNHTQAKNMAVLEGFWAAQPEDDLVELLFDARQSLLRGQLWSALWPCVKRASLVQPGGALQQQLWLADAEQILEHLEDALPSLSSVFDLLDWLVKQIARTQDKDEVSSEAFARRPSAQQSNIVIMTQHKSKGLQFNHVLLPFAWHTAFSVVADDAPKTVAKFHQERSGAQVMCWDLGGDDWRQHRAQQEHETVAESMRLLYVAITRARETVWAAMVDQVWSSQNGRGACFQTSALVRAITATPVALQHGLETADALVGTKKASKDGKPKTQGSLLALHQASLSEGGDADAGLSHHQSFWQPWVDASQGQVKVHVFDESTNESVVSNEAVWVTDSETTEHADAPAANPQPCTINDDFTHTSYSRLFSGSAHWQPLPPTDAAEERTDAIENSSAVGGSGFGSAVHECLELIDVADWPSDAQTAVLSHVAGKYALDETATRLLAHLVKLAIELPTLDGHALADISEADFLREPRFAVDLQRAQIDGLNWMLDQWRGFSVSNVLKPHDLNGLLVGAIDALVRVNGRYLVVDYKTNRVSDYQPETLTTYVAHHHYDAQYLLYALATHRWLRLHLADYDPSQHFGGVCYLFLRGLNAEDPNAGIHRKTPTAPMLHALDAWAEGKDLDIIQSCWRGDS